MEKTSKWSQEYKDSIDCNNPKGFSQRAHCQGLKKKNKKAEDTLHELHTAATELEELGFVSEASAIHEEFIKLAKNHGGLQDWFKNEKWVDLRRPKKDGGYEPCGRSKSKDGKKPVCTPANKAKNLDKKERSQRLREKAKKEKEPNPDKKPNTTKYSPGAGGKSNVS
jgi:hypothetical protein